MAVGKRSTRRVAYAGQYFRWRCDFHVPQEKFSKSYAKSGSTWRPDTLVIRPEEGPHRLLTVSWPACEAPVMKPSLVRVFIEEAMRRGWLTELSTITLPGT